MNTKSRTTKFTVPQEFEVTMMPAGGGRTVTVNGWTHYPWHVFITSGTEAMATSYGTGTGITEFVGDSGMPTIPSAASALQSIASDIDLFVGHEDVAEFAETLGVNSIRQALTTWAALEQMHADVLRLFPNNLDAFLDTFRED